jgi:hypothetical protein
MTTDYVSTFIAVADDCPATAAEVPPTTGRAPSVAALQYALLVDSPYALTSDDLLFEVHARRVGIEEQDRAARRAEFFSRPQACLRSSPLAKRYGWGFHHDADARVALVPLGSPRYEELRADGAVRVVKAMRSRRA